MANPEDTREVWKNAIAGVIGVNQFGARGEIRQTQVRSGQQISLTTEERTKLNIAADEENDPFKNGFLVPVTLAEDVEDLEEIKSNPNALGETEIKELVNGHWKTLEATLADISQGQVLDRFKEVAIAENVSVSTVQRIQDRIDELDLPPTEGPWKVKAFETEPRAVGA